MAYLMIVMQTILHNPAIKKKLQAKDFVLQAKGSCPKSLESLPESYVEDLYNNILSRELFSPLTRNWYSGVYSEADFTICNIKTSLIGTEGPRKISLTDFVNTADLTAPQLFSFNNWFSAVEPEGQNLLVMGALR